MRKEEFCDILGDINEDHIKEAHMVKAKSKHFVWLKWCAFAACMCLTAGLGILLLPQNTHGGGITNGTGWLGSSDSSVGTARRENFSSEFPSEAEAAFADVPGY